MEYFNIWFECGEYSVEYCQSNKNIVMDMKNVMKKQSPSVLRTKKNVSMCHYKGGGRRAITIRKV
jgi:hypothetical protein